MRRCSLSFFIAILGAMAACQHSKSSRTPTDNTARTPTGTSNSGDGSLPPYLFTVASARAIQPWGEPYVPSQDAVQNPPSIPSGEALRSFMEGFVNRMMQMDDVKPGRNLHVIIAQNPEQNAYADGRENVVVQTGIFSGMTSTDILGILCHEMTHSLRNDDNAIANFMDNVFVDNPDRNPRAAAFYQKVNAFISRQYNARTKAYTHNVAAYQSILADWRTYRADYWTFSKRIESTADVIGGGICASIGMSPENFKQDFVRLKNAVSNLSAEDVLQDGTKYKFNSTDELFGALFIDDDHPSFDERIDQIERLKPFFNDHLSSNQSMLQEWQTKFIAAVPANLSSFGLAGDVLPPNTMRVPIDDSEDSVIIRTNDTHHAPKRHFH